MDARAGAVSHCCWLPTGTIKSLWLARRRRHFNWANTYTAMEYFDQLPRERREQPDLANLFEMTGRILAMDPFLSGLSAEVRAQRAANALTLAQTRAETCARQTGQPLEQTPPQTELQRLYAAGQRLQQDWTPRYLERFPDRLDAAMAYVFAVENAAANACGERRAMIARCGCWAAAGRW